MNSHLPSFPPEQVAASRVKYSGSWRDSDVIRVNQGSCLCMSAADAGARAWSFGVPAAADAPIAAALAASPLRARSSALTRWRLQHSQHACHQARGADNDGSPYMV